MERVQTRVMTKSTSLENTVLEERLDLFVFFLKKEKGMDNQGHQMFPNQEKLVIR